MEVIGQLGELLLTAVPTIILLMILWAAYTVILHRPMARVLAERHARTAGAAEQARADVAAAEARAAEYEQRLREARAAIFKAQEARWRQATEVRAAALAQAREAAGRMLAQARTDLDQEKETAQGVLRGESDKLAREVINAVLRPATVAGGSR